MSSPTPSYSSSNPANTDPPNNGGPSGSGDSSSSLYLFTFLATLSLLLVISCSIILRTIVIRRRFRRRMEEALAAGALPPTDGRGRSRRSRRFFGDKPKLYDAWAQPGGEKWESIMPISAKLTATPPLSRTNTSENFGAAQSPTPSHYRPSWNPFNRWTRRSPPSSRDQSPPLTTHGSLPSPQRQEEGIVQVSVLVAMPSSAPPLSAKWVVGEEPGVPDVVVGVAHLAYRVGDSKPADAITNE